MTITIQVDLTIRSDMVPEFLRIINDDKKTALDAEDGIISSFDIINNEFGDKESFDEADAMGFF